jgi:transcriptional regulator with XRE-family HTH domain
MLRYWSLHSHVFRYGQVLILEQMPEQQNIVGATVRRLREKKGLTQAQLVAKLNLAGWDLSRGTFSKIEAQIRCVADYELLKLAAGLGIDAPELIRLAAKEQISVRPKSA